MDAMKYWFTADWHLWHKNVIVLCNRPHPGLMAMHEAFQDAINRRVRVDDCLVVCGDLAFGNPDRLAKWLDGLRCKNLVIAWGNHDDAARRLHKREPSRFRRTGDIVELKLPTVKVVCCHYAMRTWHWSGRGALHVYGHSHGNLPVENNRSMDVGVDTNIAFAPYSLEDIIETVGWQPYNPQH
jgi:calcineurin-like phosphoesterase family protein